VEFSPRSRVYNNGVTALSCDALGRLLAGSVFQSFRNRTEFRITALTQRKEIPGQRRLINSVLFAGPTLNSFEVGNDKVGTVDVETSVRSMNLQCVGMYPVHQNVDVQIIRVLMHCVDGLMIFPFHELEEISDGEVHLFCRGLFPIFPAQNPMGNRHLALDGLFGKSDHFVLLSGASRGQKIQRARVRQLFLPVVIVRGKDVIHQLRNHDGLGLTEVRALHFFDDHSRLSLSMACRIVSRVASIFGSAC